MKNKKGFTLVEIIVVISILIVITGIFSVNMINTLDKNKEEENKNLVGQVISAADAYVSANPEEVEKLYNGYGYVDIPIGDLRNGGLLSEELKDNETGERIPDEDIVRVKLETGDVINIIYPVPDEDKNLKAWSLVAEDLKIDYNVETTRDEWCGNNNNLFYGLYDSRFTNKNNYSSITSKMYLMDNANYGVMYNGDYLGDIGFSVVSCNVNPQVAGTYNITYSFKDPSTKVEKTKNRTVYVRTSGSDVVKFEAIINDGNKIVRTWPANIKITETYKDGKTATFDVPTTSIKNIGYSLEKFSTQTVGTFTAIVKKLKPNSDGSIPDAKNVGYVVIPDTYTLTYNANGGSVTPKSKIVTYMKSYSTLPTPTRTGYDFDGWFTSSSGGTQVKSTTIMDKLYDHTIYTHWTPKVFKVTFNANGGSTGTSSKTVTYDSTYGTLPTPSRTGYDFNGWYTSSSGGSKVTSSTKVQILSNQTLYARWTAKTFTVTFNGNGGSVGQSSKTVTYDSTYGTLPSASRSGYYYFDGWYTSSSGGSRVTSSTTVKITSSQVLYAHWYYDPPPPPPPRDPAPVRPPSGGGSKPNTGNSGSGSGTTNCDVLCQMEKNSNEWWDIEENPNMSESEKEKAQEALHKENEKLSDQLPIDVGFNGGLGTWEDESGNPIYDVNRKP